MLSKEKIEEYKNRLQKNREQLLKEIEQYENPETFGKDTEDEDEKTDEAEEMGNRLAIANVKREELESIENALRKIEEGTYGVCDQCGKAISEKVLDAAPESLLCEDCKKKS